jgi:hypothetical protein
MLDGLFLSLIILLTTTALLHQGPTQERDFQLHVDACLEQFTLDSDLH